MWRARWEKVRGWWQDLLPRQRLALGAGGLLVALTLAGLVALSLRRPAYAPLFTNLNPTDAAAVMEQLKAEGIPYRLAGDGSIVEVPAAELYRARLRLAARGLPGQGVVGLEAMDENPLGATDFDRRVRFLRALQGELTRTIAHIDGVEDVRVHLNIPEPSLFIRDERPPSAAVLLTLRPGRELDPGAVRGIRELVSRSVEGLTPDRVVILDQNGRVLTDDLLAEEGGQGPVALRNLDVQREFESRLRTSLNTLLAQVLGPGQAEARVSAELNFDERVTDHQWFEPVQDNDGIVRRMEELQESYQGQGGLPVGIAGTAANIPAYAVGGTTGNANFQRNQAKREYEVNQWREQIKVAPGTVRRLSVAVAVNRQLTPELQRQIADLITAAVGVDPERRDQVTVVGIPFERSLLDDLRAAEARHPFDRRMVAAAAAAAAVLLAAVFWLLLRRRRRVREAAPAEPAESLEGLAPPLGPQPAAGPVRAPAEVELAALVRQRPADVARVIRMWLSEN